MAVLPEEIPTGLITGQFYFVNEDNIDADTDPNLTVVTGKVTFTAEVEGKVLRMPTKKAFVIPLTFDATFDTNGNLIPEGGTGIGIELPATNSPLLNPTDFTWKVEFDLKDAATNFSVIIPSFSFQVPEGVTTDLVDVMPVDSQPGVLTVQGPQGNPGDLIPAVGGLNATGTVTLGLNTFPSTRRYALIGNSTFVLPTPNAAISGTYTFVFVQDNTGGRTITWPAGVKWSEGIVQQPASGPNTTTLFHFLWVGNFWYGMLGGKSFA